MISNIIKLTLRVIGRNKVFSILNLAGLVIGLSCSLLIFMWVWNEIRFDRFHENLDHLFIFEQTLEMSTGELLTDRCGPSCGPALLDEIPEITNMTRIHNGLELLLSWINQDTLSGEGVLDLSKSFVESNILAADSSFFEMFSFPFSRGNPATALKEPYSIVLTEEMAQKYFGDDDPLDQVIRIAREYDFRVTGVCREFPENSTLQFDFIVPFDFLNDLGARTEGFEGNPYFTYLYIDNPSEWKVISDSLPSFFRDKLDPEIKTVQKLLPFKNQHLKGESKGIYGVLMFSLLSALILIIACINFMNMSTARFVDRTLEVGIRKVIGATRWQLIRQFIGETLIIVFIALNLSILIVDLSLPRFNQYFEADISLELGNPVIIFSMIGILILTSLIAGSYPALFLSSFKPLDVIRKSFISSRKGGSIRKILVVIQFSFSIIFVICSIYIYKQYDLLSSLGYGLRQENLMYIPARGDLDDNYSDFKFSLLQLPEVENVSTASHNPLFVDQGEFEWGVEPDASNALARVMWAGYDFDQTLGMNLVKGRFYSSEYPTDSTDAIVINESVARAIELEDPVGETFYLYEDKYTIIGVVEDFSSFPIKLGGENLIIPFTGANRFVFIKMSGMNRNKVTQQIEKLHEKFNPGYPFIYFFLEDYKDTITEMMHSTWKIVFFFTLFGIFISCLGLLGLSIFSTQQRNKEISIRRVHGANLPGILLLVNKEFLKLTAISFVIGVPASIMIMRLMVKQFYEQTEIGLWGFILVGLALGLISVVTVSYQALRTARGNLASNLRYE